MIVNKFQDLVVWQQGHQVVLIIYRLTKSYPREETYSLVDQLRRAAVSVTSNIAEGFGRKSVRERVQFYYLSMGSLLEIENQLLVSKDLGYMTVVDFEKLCELILSVKRLLNRLITVTRQAS